MEIKNNIAEYFFSLLYSENIPQDCDIKVELPSSYPQGEIFAIILACNNRNKDIFLNTALLQEIFQSIKINLNQSNIQLLQKAILDYLQQQTNLTLINEIFEHLTTLKTQGVILYEEEQCIKTSFKYKLHELTGSLKKHTKAPKYKKTKTFDVQNSWFYQHLKNIQDVFKKLKSSACIPLWLQDFIEKEIIKLTQTQFKISLSGIAKSGKSTLLNALLYEEVLPISAIPESTNKITIAYSPQAKAEIKFLNQEEWDYLLQSLYFDDELKITIQENQKYFGEYLQDCITQEGLSIEIKPDEVKTYASSEHSSKMAYLVKELTIHSPTEFLKNNLVFINTPNINTNFNYKIHQTENSISQSIITLYLINASKPISQKDIEFLSRIIHYENLEKILIIFTRSDLVSLPDLKNLSQNILKEIQDLQIHHSKTLDKDILKIDFIPVSSTLALLHRTNRSDEALCRGYDIEDTGILALEEYINEIIFKQPTKYSKNLVLNTYTILQYSLTKSLNLIENAPINQEISETKLKTIQKEIIASAQEITEAIDKATQYSKIKIKDLGLNLKEHLLDFIVYETSKNKYINATRLENIIANNLKDSLKYLINKNQEDFNKKIKIFLENINKIYSSIHLDEFELDILKLYETNIISTIKYQYTEGDLNLYTDELKKYINHLLHDGAKLKDIKTNIDKAFELSYTNIIIFLEEKIQIRKDDFEANTTQMLQALEFIITNNHAQHNSMVIKDKTKQIQIIQNLEEIISKQIKELKALK